MSAIKTFARRSRSRCTVSLSGFVGALLFASAASAVTTVPTEGGISGYVNVGVGGMEVESNLLASVAGGLADIADRTTADIQGSPDSEGVVVPMLNFELSYTFEKSRTQIYIGNLLEDFLSFDLSAQGGIRQDVPGMGIFGLAVLNTSLSAEVWEDPYQQNVRRADTELTAQGYRVNWSRMFDSGLQLQYSSKELDVDRERSGEGLGLSPAERRLLDRNGDISRFEISYELGLAERRHILTPALFYRESDRDGAAMANDGYGASLNYVYTHSQRWRWVFNVSYLSKEYDDVNPVYGAEDEADSYGAAVTAFYSAPFGWKPWVLNATAAYFDEDHDIDFYDASVAALTVSMLRRF